MPLEFTCPACRKALTAPFAAAGLSGNCKFCHARIVAPQASGQPATLAAEPAASTVGAPSGPGPSAGPGAGPDPGIGPGMSAPFADPLGPPTSDGAPGYATGRRPDLPPDISGNPRAASAFISSGTPAVADFWKRFLGFGIDIILIIAMHISLATLMLRGQGIEVTSFWMATGSQMGRAFWFTFTLFAARVLYGAAFEGSTLQATPGKFVLGMKVCSEQGARISFLQALWRNFCKWATISIVSFVPIIGFFPYAIFFYAMRDDLTQTLHDMLASTVVAERYY